MIWRTVFGRTSILGGWWFGVVWTGRSFSFIIIHSAKCSFFYSSISANHHVAKSVLRQGTKSILSPKEQRRPLPSFLYKFFFYAELPAQGGPWSTPTTSWMPRFSTIKRPVKVRLLGAVMLRSTRPPWCKTGSRSSYFQLFCFTKKTLRVPYEQAKTVLRRFSFLQRYSRKTCACIVISVAVYYVDGDVGESV